MLLDKIPPAPPIISESLRLSFQVDYFVLQVRHAFGEIVRADQAIQLYFSEKRYRKLSPNSLFDEAWYCAAYEGVGRDVHSGDVLSGFHHFVHVGVHEGRWPNNSLFGEASRRSSPLKSIPARSFDAQAYLAQNADARIFLAAFPLLTPHGFYELFGRKLNRTVLDSASVEMLLRSGFDEDYYLEHYPEARASSLSPFLHYFHIGSRNGHSPNAQFSEEFYLAFYREIREAVQRGEIHCGYYHFLVAGQAEGRMPRHDLGSVLEKTIPGVTAPALQKRAADLRHRLAPLVAAVRPRESRKLWVFVPRLNPDILFGGYKAFFELLRALDDAGKQDGFQLEIVTTEEWEANKDYFLWRMKGSRTAELFGRLNIRGRGEIATLEMSPDDRFLCYSSWDALLAAPLAARTDEPRVISLIQEYEPIFHDFSATHAISAAGFEVEAFPVFNSHALATYFRQNGFGLFKKKPDAVEGVDYLVFEHVINILPQQSPQEMRAKQERLCAIYARPEGHAARNLYEFVELALEKLCLDGHFGPQWRFIGLGGLTDIPPVDLGGGHKLEFKQKMSEEEYIAYASAIDLGLSLMYAPHPSVVPFEFCTTGAVVVTNTFQNRPPAFFEAISSNIVTCEPNLDSFIDAIKRALVKVEDFDARAANAFHPQKVRWDQVFNADFVKALPLRPKS